MTQTHLHAVLLDMGGTPEEVYYDDQLCLQATHEFRDLLVQHDLDPGLNVLDFWGPQSRNEKILKMAIQIKSFLTTQSDSEKDVASAKSN